MKCTIWCCDIPFICCDWSKPDINIEPLYESNIIFFEYNDDNSVLLSDGEDEFVYDDVSSICKPPP